jgi:hypothetical protein
MTVQTRVRLDGADLTTAFVSATQVTATIPAALLLPPRIATLQVFSPAPGGGLSVGISLPVQAPRLTTISPVVISPLVSGGPGASLTLTGTDFHTAALVYANQTPLSTTVGSSTQLTAVVPSSLAAAQVPGGLAISVENFGIVPSNTMALEVTDHQNRGTVNTNPLAPQSGEVFAVRLEGAVAGSPFTLVMDLSNIPPIVPFPDPAADFVLAVNPATMINIIDGLGVFGPPSLISFTLDPAGTPPGGVFLIPGVAQPNPPAGIAVTDQFFYLDPSHPTGLRFSHGLRYQL